MPGIRVTRINPERIPGGTGQVQGHDVSLAGSCQFVRAVFVADPGAEQFYRLLFGEQFLRVFRYLADFNLDISHEARNPQ